MKTHYIRANKLLSFFISILIITILSIISYNFFISNFKTLEKEQNVKNIHTVLDIMNQELQSIEATITDYAIWDDTYDFIDTQNKDYLFTNFREGSSTLQDLNIDFMIFTDLNNKKIFSQYINDDIYKNFQEFEIDTMTKFEKPKEYLTLYKYSSKITKYKSNYYYIVKLSINNSDNSRLSNGFLYGGKRIHNDILNRMTKVFDKASFKNQQFKNNTISINTDYLKNTKIFTKENASCNCLVNTIQLFDSNNNYVISIETHHKRDLIQRGKETILIYNLVIGIFLLFIFFLAFKNQRLLETYSEQLEEDIQTKTRSLLKANKRLQELAQEDALTKIHNRRHFFALGKQCLQKSIKEQTPLCIVMIDIDDFKQVNDRFGHDVGDQVLISFTKQVSEFLDKDSIFGRLGGEEFSVIFPNKTLNEAYIMTEKIRLAISESNILSHQEIIHYTISLGLTEKKEERSLDTLLKKADMLLYNAKDSGKNCIIRDRK